MVVNRCIGAHFGTARLMLQLAVQTPLINNIAFDHAAILHAESGIVKLEKNSGGFFLLEM